MNEITELEKRRAVNTIWNGARDHSFQPDFKMPNTNTVTIMNRFTSLSFP